MNNTEHMLTIIEPTGGGDATVDIARDVVSRGGRASLLLVITDRVAREIGAFADSEDLNVLEAEGTALRRLSDRFSEAIGGVDRTTTHFGALGTELVTHIAPDVTSVAIPEGLLSSRLVERVVAYSGRPVVVAPARSAALAAG